MGKDLRHGKDLSSGGEGRVMARVKVRVRVRVKVMLMVKVRVYMGIWEG